MHTSIRRILLIHMRSYPSLDEQFTPLPWSYRMVTGTDCARILWNEGKQSDHISVGMYAFERKNHGVPQSSNITVISPYSSQWGMTPEACCMHHGEEERWYYNFYAFREELRFLGRKGATTRDWRKILSDLSPYDALEKREILCIPPTWRWCEGKYEYAEHAFLWTQSLSRPDSPYAIAFTTEFIREFPVQCDTFLPIRWLT